MGVEVVNKIAPLIIVHHAQKKLGTVGFGEAQFLIALMDIAIPFVVCGYHHYGTTHLNHLTHAEEKSSFVSNIMMLKFFHSLVIYFSMLLFCFLVPSFSPYIESVAILGTFLFFSSIDLFWLHIAIQKLNWASLTLSVGKFLSLAFILLCVQDPSDMILYAFLTLLSNAVIGVLTFWKGTKEIPLIKPDWQKIKKIFQASWPYAPIVVLPIFSDRIDLIWVELKEGSQASGLYAGSVRLVHAATQIAYGLIMSVYSEMLVLKDLPQRNKIFHLNLKLLAMMGIVASVFVYFFGGKLLSFIFDESFSNQEMTLFWLVSGGGIFLLAVAIGYQVLLVEHKPFYFILGLLLSPLLFLFFVNYYTVQNISDYGFYMFLSKLMATVFVLLVAIKIRH